MEDAKAEPSVSIYIPPVLGHLDELSLGQWSRTTSPGLCMTHLRCMAVSHGQRSAFCRQANAAGTPILADSAITRIGSHVTAIKSALWPSHSDSLQCIRVIIRTLHMIWSASSYRKRLGRLGAICLLIDRFLLTGDVRDIWCGIRFHIHAATEMTEGSLGVDGVDSALRSESGGACFPEVRVVRGTDR
jgi:hypothetical protein